MAWYTALAIAAAVPTMPISRCPWPHRVEVRVVFVDPGRLDPEHVGMGGHVVLGQVVVEEAAAVLVDHGLLHQRHAQPHRHAADELGLGQRLVDDEARGEHPEQPGDPHLSGVHVHPDLGELRPERVPGELRVGLDILAGIGRTLGAAILQQVLAGLDDSRTHEAVPIEPPASDAVGSALSPSSTRT